MATTMGVGRTFIFIFHYRPLQLLATKGLRTGTPAPAKRSFLRVTSVRSWIRAVAAICRSGTGQLNRAPQLGDVRPDAEDLFGVFIQKGFQPVFQRPGPAKALAMPDPFDGAAKFADGDD